MKLFVNVYNDAKLLRHFLEHYSRAGISQFFIAARPEFVETVRQYETRYKITLFQGLDIAVFGTASIDFMRRAHQDAGEWVVITDLDEFIEFEEDISAIVARAEETGANVVRGIMYDRFSADGQLADVPPDGDLAAIFPVKSQFILRVMGGCDHKGVLVKGQLVPAALHHRFEGERLSRQLLAISHYKWLTGSIDRLRKTYRITQEARVPWAIEYRRALDHYDKHGRFAWEEFGGQPAKDFIPPPPQRCVDCDAPISGAEYAFSTGRFGKALCRTDQRNYAKTS